jgi:hypothetical protein
MRNAGTINVARSIFEHPVFKDGKPYSQREAWLWLIANAAWRPMQVMVRNGRSQELVSLDRGQMTYSRAFLRAAWSWTSEKMVRTFLARLRQEGMLDLQTGQLQTVITVCNYSHFQFGGEDQGPANGPDMGQQRAGNGPEEEAIKSIKTNNALPTSTDFNEWYAIYPKKKQPQTALRAFTKVIASGLITFEELMAKTRAFAATWENEPKDRRKFIPYPASWLNAGSYHDEPEVNVAVPALMVRDPQTYTDVDWQKRLDYYQQNGTWIDAWGARPGDPGSFVPAHLIVAVVPAAKGAA